jgi:fatty acid desaturase
MDAADREAFRQRDRPVAAATWIAILAICVACGWGLGILWSFALSIPLMAVLALFGLELHLRWVKQRWIRRFPELSAPGTRWRRRDWP